MSFRKQLTFLILLLVTFYLGLALAGYEAIETNKLHLKVTSGTSRLTMQAPTLSNSWSMTMPTSAGTVDYYLKTNGSGVTSWGDVTGQAANKSLSNLTSPTSINQHLVASAGTMEIGSAATPWNYIRTKFLELYNGANKITIKSPGALAIDKTYNLPVTDGTNGQVLQTDGSGNLSFTTPPGAGAGAPGGGTGAVQYNNAGVFGGSNNLFWDIANARLGINTSTPNATLSLSKTHSVSPSIGNTIQLKRSDNNLYGGGIWSALNSNGNDTLNLGASSNYDMFSNPIITIAATTAGTTGGYVGFSTLTPAAKLHIVDQTNSGWRYEQYNDSDGNNYRNYRARGTIAAPTAVQTGDRLASFLGAGYNGSAFSTPVGGMSIWAAENFVNPSNSGTYVTLSSSALGTNPGGGGLERVRIAPGGEVGIGTTPNNPAAKLHVYGQGTTSTSYTNGDAVGQTLYLQDSGGGAGNGGQILFAAAQGAFAGIKSYIVNGTGPAGELFFQTRDTTGNIVDRMQITSTGNVRVGWAGTGPTAIFNSYGGADVNVGKFYNYTNSGGTSTVLDVGDDRGFAGATTGKVLNVYQNTNNSNTGTLISANTSSLGDIFKVLSNGIVSLVRGQLEFPATQIQSSNVNTLDDYEEGTWTPIVGGTATYFFNFGRYTKIGRKVFIEGSFSINLIGTGSTSVVSGLPFTSMSANPTGSVVIHYFNGLATPVVFLAGSIEQSTTSFILYSTTAAAATTTQNAVLGNASRIYFSGHYTTN